MGKPKSAGQQRLNRMRFLCKLTMQGKLKIEDLVENNRDLSATDVHQIFENYAENKLGTKLPKIGSLVIAPNSRRGIVTGECS
jgi:hypothetical protein